jgi:hypothetical protein
MRKWPGAAARLQWVGSSPTHDQAGPSVESLNSSSHKSPEGDALAAGAGATSRGANTNSHRQMKDKTKAYRGELINTPFLRPDSLTSSLLK